MQVSDEYIRHCLLYEVSNRSFCIHIRSKHMLCKNSVWFQGSAREFCTGNCYWQIPLKQLRTLATKVQMNGLQSCKICFKHYNAKPDVDKIDTLQARTTRLEFVTSSTIFVGLSGIGLPLVPFIE